MMATEDFSVPVPWWRKLGVRFAWVCMLALLVVGLIVEHIGDAYDEWLYPRWYDADFLRLRADAVDAYDAGEMSFHELMADYEEVSEWALWTRDLFALAVGGMVFVFVVSILFTRRLSQLQTQTLAADADRLPGPFSISGHDELGALATSMNGMRSRILELIEQLEQRDSERRTWIAQVSHDLRTPITALAACLDRVERTLPEDGARRAETATALELAREDVARMQAYAEDLLALARLEVDSQPRFEPVLPAELARQVFASLKPLGDSSGQDWFENIARGLPTLGADGHLLARALENLLRNASQHARSRVEMNLLASGDGVCFEIADDGSGWMESDTAIDVADYRRKQQQQGSGGLGLAVVERVAALHGGRAEIVRDPTRGTLAKLYLPSNAMEQLATSGDESD